MRSHILVTSYLDIEWIHRDQLDRSIAEQVLRGPVKSCSYSHHNEFILEIHISIGINPPTVQYMLHTTTAILFLSVYRLVSQIAIV